MLDAFIKEHMNVCGLKPPAIHMTKRRFEQLKQDIDLSEFVDLTEGIMGYANPLTNDSYLKGTYKGIKIIIHDK